MVLKWPNVNEFKGYESLLQGGDISAHMDVRKYPVGGQSYS